MGENNTIAQINNDSIQSLLSLGKELSAVDIINQLADEIKQLSFQKAEIESQLLLNQRLKSGSTNKKDITFDQVNNGHAVTEVLYIFVGDDAARPVGYHSAL